MRFQYLYEKYSEEVYRFAFWLSGDRDEAKDIASETFLRVWTAKAEIRLESVKAYLLAIARNIYLHEKRKRGRQTTIGEEVEDRARRPDQSAEVNADLELTLKAIQTLPEIDRTILIMRGEEGLPYEEIARLTGLSLSAVKVRVFRARLKLTEMLEERKGRTR